MALEHNLIYFATRAKVVNNVVIETPRKVAVHLSTPSTVSAIRAEADSLGIPLSLFLKRLEDPDRIDSVLTDRKFSFAILNKNLTRFADSANKVREDGVERGIATPLIAKDYFKVLYSSYLRHVDEVDAMLMEDITGVRLD